MTLLDDLEALLDPTAGKPQHPRGSAKGKTSVNTTAGTAELVEFTGNSGELTVHGDTPVHDWQEVLKIALPPGFNVEDYRLVGDPRVTSHTILTEDGWENVQAWWKIAFTHASETTTEDDEDAERLIAELTDFKVPPARELLTGDDYFIVNACDWQFGQHDAGGTPHTLRRLDAIFANVCDRVRFLRAAGRKLGTAVIGSGGDLFEGCQGFYPMQQATVDLDRRQQGKVTRRVLIKLIKLLVDLGFERVLCVAVPGNHGENRQDGKAFMGWGDNDDVAVWESVYDIIAETQMADLCEWVIPNEDLTVNVDLAGRTLGWTHGHQCRGRGGTPQAKVWDWWTQQAMGRNPAGDCDVLNVAHFHHFYALEHEHRLLLGQPAACGTSRWWQESSGQGSAPGQMTYVVTPHSDRPITDLEIISPTRKEAQ